MNLKKIAFVIGFAALLPAMQAHAHVESYDVITTFFEPDTQPRNTIFIGTFDFDAHTKTVTSLKGKLSEAMSGDPIAYNPATGINGTDTMTWLDLTYQLSSVYDATLGGLFVTVFKNPTTATFLGNTWKPEDGLEVGNVYAGFPSKGKNPGNAYVTIFVNTTDPTAAINKAQLNKLAYADCAPGGMMGATCMTGTSAAAYGDVGSMGGYPRSQVITLSVGEIPEPASYAMLMAGLGLMGVAKRRKVVV